MSIQDKTCNIWDLINSLQPPFDSLHQMEVMHYRSQALQQCVKPHIPSTLAKTLNHKSHMMSMYLVAFPTCIISKHYIAMIPLGLSGSSVAQIRASGRHCPQFEMD